MIKSRTWSWQPTQLDLNLLEGPTLPLAQQIALTCPKCPSRDAAFSVRIETERDFVNGEKSF